MNNNNNFDDISIKNLNLLFQEITSKNSSFRNTKYIFGMYDKIKNNYENNVRGSNESFLRIKIKELKSKILSNINDQNNYIELISLMIKVNEIVFNYKPREIQIIAVLYFLFKDKNAGLIEEILTGEGKTIIISFLAVIKAFQGKKIDILTSSLVLAERDANEMRNFYNYFGLSVDYCKNYFKDNFKKEFSDKKECFDCYNKDIVYGDCLSFESDILRTEFMGIIGRGKIRNFDCIIIDEIDNICIDNIKNITELLDNFHGYKFLEYIYLFIYNELAELDKEIWKEVSYIQFKHDIGTFSMKNYIVEILLKRAENEFSDLKFLAKNKNIFLPEHLSNFIKFRLKKWCESAYDAMYIYKENKEYIIAIDERYGFNTIKPVDFSNTGVVQENSVWTGLHQFLQIKEGLRLTQENLNSCYMSNFTFFKKYISKYENNIFGLTGTLGSKKTQNALNILYNLNLLFIPTFKECKLKQYPPLLIKDYDNYNNYLLNIIKDIVFNKGRSVLVIFKYIEEVLIMYDLLLKNKIDKKLIIKYTRNDINNERNFLKNEISPYTIILSTNLSGRGTDIKINKELEKKKGLHVILTFLPFSERIERQAFGRAGRKGENGSGQLIIYSQDSLNELIQNREKDEENEFQYLIKIYKRKIDLFQELFEQFSHFLNKVRKRKDIDESILLDIKERWGIFLVENDLAKIDKKYKDKNSLIINEQMIMNTRIKFNQFMFDLKNKVDSGYEYLNPLLLCKTFSKTKCDLAVEKSPILALGAYSFRSLFKIDKKLKNYKIESLNDFLIIERNCIILLNQFIIYENMMNKLKVNRKSDLFKQNQEKILFINEYIQLIRNNINIMKKINNDPNSKHIEVVSKIINLDDINVGKKYNQDTLDYFKDFGMCLYILSCTNAKEEGCNIY
jgi:preprotein translocase subunit SecA